MLPSSVRTTPTAVGSPVLCDTGFYERTTAVRSNNRYTGTPPPGSCITIRIREQPAFFGISKPIAWRMTTAFAGTPSFTAASQSRTVWPSTAPRTTWCVARSSRNCSEEVTGASLCTMKPSKRHERWLEVLARATSSTHKSTLSSIVCHQQAKVEFLGQGFLASMNRS